MYYTYSTSSSIVVVLLDLVICPQVCALTQYAPGVPQRLCDVSCFTEFEYYPIILPKLSKYYTYAYTSRS